MASPVMAGSDSEDVPGTVYLVDLDNHIHGRHAEGELKEIVLVPAPSADPDDPLNWSSRRKALSTICMCVYTLMNGIAGAAIYSVFGLISEDTGLTLDDLNAGTGYLFLLAGWGCLVWQPLAQQYGKRPVYLFTLLAVLATQLWTPHIQSRGQWFGCKILQGLASAPIESLCEISVADVYFQHERGAYIGLYALLLAGSNYFAPIIAGWIGDGQGWKWVPYWCAIFCAAGFVFLFFFMEETNYSRQAMIAGRHEPAEQRAADSEKKTAAEHAPENSPTAIRPTHPRKTYLDKLKLWRTEDLHKPNRLRGMVTRPLVFLSFPVIFYAGFSYGSSLVWFNVLNGTASLVLSGTYGFSAGLVGTAYVSPLLGAALGALYTGPIGDRVVLRMARRNDGIAEPEHRLWLFLPSLLGIPLGLMLWGIGAAHHVPWIWCVIAMCIISVANTIGLQLSVSYCIDSYRDLAAEAMVTVILVRNTMSFAVGYGLTPWVEGMGLQNAFILAGLVGAAQCATFFFFVRYGKALRRASAGRYAKYVDEIASNGMVH